MRTRLLAFLVTFLVGLGFAMPTAQAITWGTPDGDAHPHVGLMVFDTGGTPSHRCSGTLLTATVMLTAGHCTVGTSGGRVWFDSDVGAGRPENGYPFAGGTGIEFASIHTHPQYNDSAFFLHDAGIVVLSESVSIGARGALPDAGLLDGLMTQRGLQEQRFVPVGYGVQSVVPNPNEVQADLVRYNATLRLIDGQGTAGIPAGTSVLFTSNPGRPASGGQCFGDSGGPVFWHGTSTIVAVSSFVLNTNCVGIGGGYRIDKTDDLAWIRSFL